MGEFFGSIYCWFEEFFGLDLANYLWGGIVSATNDKHVYWYWTYNAFGVICDSCSLLLCF